MNTRHAFAWAVAPIVAVLAACDGSSAGSDTLDASDAASDDSREDTELDSSDPDLTEVTRTTPDPIDPLGRCESTPAASFGRIAWMDGATLFAQRPSESGPAQPLFTSTRAGLRRPVVSLGREFHPTGPAFVITTVSSDTSAIEILDHQGNLRAAVELPGVALPPLSGSTHLVVPLSDPGPGVSWVSLATGAVGYTLPLPFAPTTPVTPFGPALLSGGGSHWIVGTDRGLVSVADRYLNRRLEDGPIDPQVVSETPRITGQQGLDGTPRALLVLGDRLVVHLERDDSHHLQLFRLALSPDRTDFIPLGSTSLPSAPTAAPVGVDCQREDTYAAFCPRFEVATVVMGGEGWLNAYHLATGAQVSLSSEPITWTGLALGRGGWVAGGGSHWLPAEPSPSPGLWLHHPLFGTEPLLTGAPSQTDSRLCIPSPVWDHGGQLALPFEGELQLIELAGTLPSPTLAISGPLGPADGPARPDGDNKNSRTPLDASACEDGTPRSLHSVPIDPATIRGLRFAEGLLLAFGASDGVGFFQWFAVNDSRWRMDLQPIPDATEITQVAMAGPGEFAVAFVDRSGQQLLDRYNTPQFFLHRTNIGSDGLGRPLFGLVPQGAGLHLIAEYPATVALVRELDGRLDEVDFGDAPTGGEVRLLPTRLDTLGGGAVLVVSNDEHVVVRRLDPALGLIASATDTSLDSPHLIDATTDSLGRIRVIIEDGPNTHLLHYDENLEPLSARRIPQVTSLITASSGDSLLVRTNGLARLAKDDALGLTHAFPFATSSTPIPVAAAGTGFMIGLPASDPPRLIVATVDPLGQAGCLAAGACVASRMLACDFVDACLAIGCEPTTGDCREEPAGICAP